MREFTLMREDMGEDHFASLVGDIALYTAFLAGCCIILRILTNFDQAVCLVGVFGHIVMVVAGWKAFVEMLSPEAEMWSLSIEERAHYPLDPTRRFICCWMVAHDFLNMICELLNGSLSKIFFFHHCATIGVCWVNFNGILGSMAPYFGGVAHISTVFSWIREPRLNLRSFSPTLYDMCTYIFALTFTIRVVVWLYFSLPFIQDCLFIIQNSPLYILALFNFCCWLLLTVMQLYWQYLVVQRLSKICTQSRKPLAKKA